MTDSISTAAKTEQSANVNLLTFSSDKPYESVIADFEKQLGYLDREKAISAGQDLAKAVKQMEGATGLMVIHVLAMDELVPCLIASGARARQYFVGNPTIASIMAEHNTLAALYVPPRLLIYTDKGKTVIAYDQPSSSLGRFACKEILETAKNLDSKFEKLVQTALA